MPAIPDDILLAQSEGRIPDGITLYYLAESRDRAALVAIPTICALVTFVVALRCYARAVVLKGFGIDDILAVCTLPFYIVVVGLSIELIRLGSGRHIEYIQYVLSMDTVRDTEVLDFVTHILYTTALFVCRVSGLAFYYRLASQHDKLRVMIIGTAAFLVTAYLPQMFLLIFHCLPVTGLWPYAWQLPDVDQYKCLAWGVVYSVNAGLSLVCDVALLAIPLALIYLLHLDRTRKIVLSFILLPGVLVLIISSVRLYLVVKGQWAADGSWYYNPMLILETSEIGGTLLALSVPALKPLLGSWANSIVGPLTSDSSAPSSKATPFSSNNGAKSSRRASRLRGTNLTTTDDEMAYGLSSVPTVVNGSDSRPLYSKQSDDPLLRPEGETYYAGITGGDDSQSREQRTAITVTTEFGTNTADQEKQ